MTTAANQPQPSAATDRVVIDIRPAWRAIPLLGFGWLVFASVLAVVCWLMFISRHWPQKDGLFFFGPILLILIVLTCAALVRECYRFQLSERRVRAARGVLARSATEAKIEHVRNVTITRSLLQRLLQLGTIEMTTAGVGPSVIWRHVARTNHLAHELRKAIDRGHAEPLALPEPRTQAATAPAAEPIVIPVPASATPNPPPSHRPPVIGLAGGIGAGKSTVAKSFERLGCFVIDSDQRAKAALDREDVREALVEWWGEEILAGDGRIDRSKVASIIFADPEQRTRLEQLVHPIVREDRAGMIREAQGAGAVAVIVDAPLLFEAGVDAECDCVVFVDAPRQQRLERVRQARQWDEAELARREASQTPVDEKRLRSQYVVENHGKLGAIEEQVAQVLEEILAQAQPEG